MMDQKQRVTYLIASNIETTMFWAAKVVDEASRLGKLYELEVFLNSMLPVSKKNRTDYVRASRNVVIKTNEFLNSLGKYND